MAPIAGIGIVIYVAGIPILFVVLLVLHYRDPSSPYLVTLTAPFRVFWAELYFLGRRLCIALASSLIPLDSPMLSVVIVIILLVAFLSQSVFEFYRWSPDNAFEVTSLAVLTLCYLLAVLSNDTSDTRAATGMQVAILLLNV